MSKSISYFINKDESIIACKKLAKTILAENNQKITLMQSRILSAQQLGFKDWFDLRNKIKHKYSLLLNEKNNIAFFEKFLSEAIENEATDIHFECKKENTSINIKFKVNGEFIDSRHNLDYQPCCDIFSHFYNDNYNILMKQYSNISTLYNIENKKMKLHIQSIPAYSSGFDIMIKIAIIKHPVDFLPLQKLGYTDQQVEQLMDISEHDKGNLIIAGHTSSYKSETLRSLIMYQNANTNYSKKIDRFEEFLDDPVFKVNSIAINNGDLIKSEADIISMPDIYNQEHMNFITKTSKKSSVFTSVVASSALGIIERLTIDFNLSIEQLAQPRFCNGLVYQQPIGMLCHDCSLNVSILFDPNFIKNNESILNQKNEIIIPNYPQYLKFLRTLEQKYSYVNINKIKLRNHIGCNCCKSQGLKYETLCTEVITIDETIRKFILENKSKEIYQYWRSQSDNNIMSPNMSGKTFNEHGLYKVLNGLIDPLNYIERFGDIN